MTENNGKKTFSDFLYALFIETDPLAVFIILGVIGCIIVEIVRAIKA